jgi:hypothetical protein
VILSHPATDDDWRESATCADGYDAELWFSTDFGDIALAQSVCMDCPVRQPCLEDGLDDEHGVWGGYTPSERQRLTRYLPTEPATRRLTLARAAYIGPAFFGVADRTHPLRGME